MIGAGVISGQYVDTLPRYPAVRLAAIADLDPARAESAAASASATNPGVRALGVDELLSADDIDLVLNLTIPAAHAEIDLRAIASGKHVFGEKPLALDVESGTAVLAAASDAGVLVGSAPDTVLGTGVQTSRALLDSGAIGDPVGASVQWGSPGHELWHPAPDFYYQPGAGPMFDMGPYYLTALVTLFGPVVRVSGASARSARERTIATGPAAGTLLPVDVDTHVVALLEHANGVISTVTVSFEQWATRMPLFEVYGTAGTISVPDPNTFSGAPEVWTRDAAEWRAVEPLGGYPESGRGVGIADLAVRHAAGLPPRASGALALHVLEIMESVLHAGRERATVPITTTVERPDPVPLGEPAVAR
jgi:predicted dehydrogenase